MEFLLLIIIALLCSGAQSHNYVIVYDDSELEKFAQQYHQLNNDTKY